MAYRCLQTPRLTALLIFFAGLGFSPAAAAQSGAQAEPSVSPVTAPSHDIADDDEDAHPWELEVEGYGELQFSWLDYGPDPTREGGARSDSRLVFDQTRFVVELKGKFPYEIEFGAEVEFEHGGTGTAMEVEYEEFGEFGTEIGKGGEVLVEELYLAKSFGQGAIRLRAGRLYVAVGLLPKYHKPTDYIASARPESAEVVLPGLWNELGADIRARLGLFELTAQVVNGLDSTGFSSKFWVSSGHQSKFELIRATDLAGVLRVDSTPIEGLLVGASAYYGGTSRNRPAPDLAKKCTDPSKSSAREVAPCGYISAPLLIVDAHAAVDLKPVRARAAVIWGHLKHAELISEQNRMLSNRLGVARTEVAEQAIAAWGEIGLDIAHFTPLRPDHRIEPYVRGEYYDTMFNRPEGSFDNPRFETYIVSAGLGYTLLDSITAKLDWSHRSHGTDSIAAENAMRLGLGFVF